MSAVIAGGLIQDNNWSEPNTGLMVIEPRKELFSQLLSATKLLPSKDGTDQGFLHSFYKNWPENQQLHLEHRFNVPVTYLDRYCENLNFKF